MKLAIKISLLALLGSGFVAAACSDDDAQTTGPATSTQGPTTSSSTGTSMGGSGGGGGQLPNVPTLGMQIDRKGRPAVNTALNNTFTDDATRGAAEDAWNANSNPANWLTDHVMDVRAGLAIIDALNAGNASDGCGDQVGFGALGNPNYLTLATVITNDFLIVKGDAADGCTSYLGVEAGPDALGLSTVDDCGGRKPDYDVIAVSFTVLTGAAAFDDGIAAGPAAMVTTFPYLAAPNAL
jgi:hypothetical protein